MPTTAQSRKYSRRLVVVLLLLPLSFFPYVVSWRQDSVAEQMQNQLCCQFVEAICANDLLAARRSLRHLDCWLTDPPKSCWRDNKGGTCAPHLFDKADLHYWRNQIFYKNLADSLSVQGDGDDQSLSRLSQAVHRQVSKGSPLPFALPEPQEIWTGGKGWCDQQAWLLCCLAYQQGFDPLIVYLCDPLTGVSHHTVCELRKNGRVWFADPLHHLLIADESTATLAAKPEYAAKLWDEHPEVPPLLAARLYWMPAEAEDYCPRHRALSLQIHQILGDSFPRCGEAPALRLQRYPADLHVQKWFVPFRIRRLYLGLGQGTF
ncbi:MAG: hypothetical protein RL095_757 [Verrucomicrobiota bacterium]|jgi:hypothetical protein